MITQVGNAAAVEECRCQLAAAQRCYHKKLNDLNARLNRQAAERQLLDEQRDACFELLQHESGLIRNQLQARGQLLRSYCKTINVGVPVILRISRSKQNCETKGHEY